MLTTVKTTTSDRPLTIAIWGHYHGGNLGDELVVDVIQDAVERRIPAARVIAISMSPADTRVRHGIESYPLNAGTRTSVARRREPTMPAREPHFLRKAGRIRGVGRVRRVWNQLRLVAFEPAFLWHSHRVLRDVDLVVVAGSGQLLDEWRGPWLHPYTTFRWAKLSRLARVPMVFLSVGAGPIENRLSAYFIRSGLSSAEYISVRDAHSARVLTSIGVPGPLPVCPDMGYGLSDRLLRHAKRASAERGEGLVVGLNVMAHQDPRYWPRGQAHRYESFLAKMAKLTGRLLDAGYTVRLFSSQPRADGRVADDLIDRLAEDRELDTSRLESVIAQIGGVPDLVKVIGACDFVVAARYHSVLLPLLMDIPVLAFAYNPKTTELLRDVGHPERCLDIDSFGVDEMLEAFSELQRQEDVSTREARRARIEAHRAAVEVQFARILDAAENRRQTVDREVVAA